MDRFYETVAHVLEVERADAQTRFRDVPNWGSLMAFGLLVMMENDFGRPIRIDQLMAAETVGDLAAFLV